MNAHRRHSPSSLLLSSLKRGAWLGAWPSTPLMNTFQSDAGCHMDIVNLFVGWETPFSTVRTGLDPIYQNGSTAMITWQPDAINTIQIFSHATYIAQFADGVKAYGSPILLRPMPEMNGNWCAWGIGNSSINTNQTYITAWKYIVNTFRQRGVTNVSFIWCINNENVGTMSSYTGAYPGDAYVDYVAIDGYNWGSTQAWSCWQLFSSVFSSAYQALVGLTQKPILLTEWASTEVGGDKAAWITDAFYQITAGNFPRIAGLIWFNEQKETDWRIESSPAAQQAYHQANQSE